MTWTELSQLLTPVGVLAGVWVSYKNAQTLRVVHDLTKQVQVETNGMKSELVKEVREASFAKGVKSETDKAAT